MARFNLRLRQAIGFQHIMRFRKNRTRIGVMRIGRQKLKTFFQFGVKFKRTLKGDRPNRNAIINIGVFFLNDVVINTGLKRLTAIGADNDESVFKCVKALFERF